jgi:pyruvate formate lyase activating enzyme
VNPISSNQSLFIKESILYEPIDPETVRCGTCERRCLIAEGKTGFCRTRINQEGKLYCLTYGNISSISNNPIEKKPFYHFFPGTMTLTIGTWSCNFTCPFCQNWDISKFSPLENPANFLSVPEFLKLLPKYKAQGTSFSFNEPTLLLEYALDVMQSAANLPYYHTYVTNMYMTEEALRLLIENGCRAFCANMKGDHAFYQKFCTTDDRFVWRNLQLARELGAHIEVVTLVIPRENDSDETLREIAHNIQTRLGENTPWHCNQYYPAYQAEEIGMANYRTPVETLEKAYKIGKDEGLKFVYVGNVHRHPLENTYCPACGTILIERTILGVSKNHLKSDNSCPNCGEVIPIISKNRET